MGRLRFGNPGVRAQEGRCKGCCMSLKGTSEVLVRGTVPRHSSGVGDLGWSEIKLAGCGRGREGSTFSLACTLETRREGSEVLAGGSTPGAC